MNWVKAKIGPKALTFVDKHIGELFNNIRFGAMSIKQFCTLSEVYGLVLSQDFQTITKLIGLKQELK